MALNTVRDIPLLVTSPHASAERRITPSWSLTQLKAKLESVTGIPPSLQILKLRLSEKEIALQAEHEDVTKLSNFPLQAYAEIHVSSTAPTTISTLPPSSSVPKYTMPSSTYESLPSTVLAWKKSNKLGRFDPRAPEILDQKLSAMWKEVEDRGIRLHERCRVGSEDSRRGQIASIGEVPEIPGDGPWIGVVLDEPVGKNDGSVRGRGYFQCRPNYGVFVRADRVDVGDFGVLLEAEDSDLEEI